MNNFCDSKLDLFVSPEGSNISSYDSEKVHINHVVTINYTYNFLREFDQVNHRNSAKTNPKWSSGDRAK